MVVKPFPYVLPKLNITTLINKSPLKNQDLLLKFPLSFKTSLFFCFFHTHVYLSPFDVPQFHYVYGLAIQSFSYSCLIVCLFVCFSFIVKLVSLFFETHFKLPDYILLLWGFHLIPEGSTVHFV